MTPGIRVTFHDGTTQDFIARRPRIVDRLRKRAASYRIGYDIAPHDWLIVYEDTHTESGQHTERMTKARISPTQWTTVDPV